jgi:hypothetical protein
MEFQAMKYKSLVYAQASGSVGGLTYSHNKGGLYTRARTIPVNPGSAFQTAVRNLMNTQVNRWSNVLTAAERAAWDVFAANVPVLDALGDAIFLSGINWFVKNNVLRRQSGLGQVDAAPTIFTLADLTAPSFTVSATTDLAAVTFDNTDDWAAEVGGALIPFFSRPQSAGINFFKGPYRVAPEVQGAASPPSSPASIALPFPVAAGNRVFARFVAVRADGRPSPTMRLSAIAV